MNLRSPSLICLLGLACLCGCGSKSSNGVASKQPDAIVAAAKAAADGARSVHVVGTDRNGGKPLAFDMNLVAGRGGSGTISENGLSFELVRIGTTAYVKGSPAFYRSVAGPAAAQLLTGKWLKAPASNADFASLSGLTDLRRLLDAALGSHGRLAKGASTTVGGQQAVTVRDTTQGGTLAVATNGKPFPLRIAKAGASGGSVLFDHWNGSFSLAPPPNPVDFSQTQHR